MPESVSGLNIGIVGCGGFARYAAAEYLKTPGTRVTAVADPDARARQAGVDAFGAEGLEDAAALAVRPDVDLVYIGSPPALHFPQAERALAAGKHVICEKPLTLTAAQADELIATAHRADRLLVANLMQRYNPIFAQVRAVLDSGVLGAVLHGFLENYACDEQLEPAHWFWDRSLSGGIFIEHGVHFFDLFAGWLGEGTVVAAQASRRPNGCEDQVQCTVRYGDETHVNFYHGFTQPARRDRQTFRLLCERGEITLEEWVPTALTITALLTSAEQRAVAELLTQPTVTPLAQYAGVECRVRSRHRDYAADALVEFRVGSRAEKGRVYAEIVRALFEDQLRWIADRSHARVVTERNGRDSVALAERAAALAWSD